MNDRKFVRTLLVTSALAAGGCSADSSRFGDFYADAIPAASNGPAAYPPGVDPRTTASIGGAAAAGVMPGATVAPRKPSMTFGSSATMAAAQPAPLAGGPAYAVATSYPTRAPAIRRAPPVTTAALAPIAAPVRDEVDLDPVPVGSVASQSNSASRSRSIADRVRAIVPLVPKAAPKEPVRKAEMRMPRDVEALERVVTAPAGRGDLPRTRTAMGAQSVTIGEGVTLYNLSKRFGVPVTTIMSANGISDPTTVQAGQIVTIPTYSYSADRAVSAPDADPMVRASAAGSGMMGELRSGPVPMPRTRATRPVAQMASATRIAQPVQARLAANPTVQAALPRSSGGALLPDGSSDPIVQVRAGDTLYAISRRTGVSVAELRRLNGLSSDNLAVGQALRVGRSTFAATTPVSAPAVDRQMTASIEPTPVVQRAEPVASAPKSNPVVVAAPAPEPKKAETVVASADPVSSTISTGASKLRWPVNGRVIREFGGTAKGLDIAVPTGTPVRAAENGTVIYAGSGLKQYGRTVLIQHADGVVTVYGHADSLKVAKGQKVRRGDVIASSGMSGDAQSPRVHFEVRKGSTPVDPASYLN